jgi:2-phosphosulfolactate phosphatase
MPPMDIRILDPSCDPASIRGLTVVVDVFRAFSVAYYIHANRPAKYLVVDDIGLARKVKLSVPGALLIGERGGAAIPGFDFGNSPTEIVGRDFSGKTVVHTTSAGTKGLLAQPRENEVVVGSFVNCPALVRFVREGGFAPEADFGYCMDLGRFDALLGRGAVEGETRAAELAALI